MALSGSSTAHRPEPAAPGSSPTAPPPNRPLPAWAPAFGGVSLAVVIFSVAWALAGRPEYGGLAERAAYVAEAFSSNRVFYAFVLDAGLYAVWQAVLMEGAPAR
jgi:hypothetical protein